MQGLQYMLNMDHSYYSHITNKQDIKHMNLAMNDASALNITWQQFKKQQEVNPEYYKASQLVADLILNSQDMLLGHVLCLDKTQLMRTVTCNEQLRLPPNHIEQMQQAAAEQVFKTNLLQQMWEVIVDSSILPMRRCRQSCKSGKHKCVMETGPKAHTMPMAISLSLSIYIYCLYIYIYIYI